ncbi:MAG: redox-sensitive transcriptional activator SoxR [Actinobacteria bacterium]|nr:redox-sensitive transcriptional activator SoxR [Actinomycetota bacterium]
MTKLNPADLLSVGEVSRRTGVSVSALHFYEAQGLIFSHRTSGNQRRYSRHMIRRVSLILVAKRLGIPLREVEEVFRELPHDRRPTKREWDRIARAWSADLELRRAALDRLQRELTSCIGCGCISMSSCRLLNPSDELGEQGPGPHRLEPFPADDDSPATR